MFKIRVKTVIKISSTESERTFSKVRTRFYYMKVSNRGSSCYTRGAKRRQEVEVAFKAQWGIGLVNNNKKKNKFPEINKKRDGQPLKFSKKIYGCMGKIGSKN